MITTKRKYNTVKMNNLSKKIDLRIHENLYKQINSSATEKSITDSAQIREILSQFYSAK